jgi:hypothetical protein
MIGQVISVESRICKISVWDLDGQRTRVAPTLAVWVDLNVEEVGGVKNASNVALRNENKTKQKTEWIYGLSHFCNLRVGKLLNGTKEKKILSDFLSDHNFWTENNQNHTHSHICVVGVSFLPDAV